MKSHGNQLHVVPCFCLLHAMLSSVSYYSPDTCKNEIYLLTIKYNVCTVKKLHQLNHLIKVTLCVLMDIVDS